MTFEGRDFHLGWVLGLMRSEVTQNVPIYDRSIKRLCLQTGLPVKDVQYVLGRLMTYGLIEPIGAVGWKIDLATPIEFAQNDPFQKSQ